MFAGLLFDTAGAATERIIVDFVEDSVGIQTCPLQVNLISIFHHVRSAEELPILLNSDRVCKVSMHS